MECSIHRGPHTSGHIEYVQGNLLFSSRVFLQESCKNVVYINIMANTHTILFLNCFLFTCLICLMSWNGHLSIFTNILIHLHHNLFLLGYFVIHMSLSFFFFKLKSKHTCFIPTGCLLLGYVVLASKFLSEIIILWLTHNDYITVSNGPCDNRNIGLCCCSLTVILFILVILVSAVSWNFKSVEVSWVRHRTGPYFNHHLIVEQSERCLECPGHWSVQIKTQNMSMTFL